LFYENVLDCIEGKATQYITKEDIRNSLAVVMACFESAEKQSVVEVKKYL
jgi:predicted dehydrogenase